MSRTFAVVGLLTLLAAAAAAAPPADRNEPKLKPVELDALPGKLKEAVAKQKGSDEVTQIVEITRGPRTVYRVRVEDAELGKARFIILGPTGEVLRELDLTKSGATVVKWESLPGEVKGAFAKKAPAEQYQQFTRVLRNAQIFYVGILPKGDPVRVDEAGNYIEREDEPATTAPDRYARETLTYDDLPGPVKSTIGQNGGDKDAVTEAFKITRGEETFYRITLKSNERVRMLRITPDGTIESERNATPHGKVKVKVDSLPGPLKGGIYKATSSQPPTEVWQVTEDAKTWYVVELDDRVIAIDDSGAVIKTEPKPGR